MQLLHTKKNLLFIFCSKEKVYITRPIIFTTRRNPENLIFPYELMNNFGLKIQKENHKTCSLQR